MLILTSTSQTIKVISESTNQLDVVTHYVDTTTTTVAEGKQTANISTATTTTVVSAPAASTSRLLKSLSIYAVSGAHRVKVVDDNSGTQRVVIDRTLQNHETLQYEDGSGWSIVSPAGTDPSITTYALTVYKSMTAADAAGYFYLSAKDSGWPGAWSPGTPGVSGRRTDGTDTATDAGCIYLPVVASGDLFLRAMALANTGTAQGHFYSLIDILWVNSGLSVTTTTSQAVASPSLPLRDFNGTSDGIGCLIGLYFTAASTNAAQISNTTVSYTNTDGVSGRTATLTAIAGCLIPATPVIGTFVPFRLQDGDLGVQSIQSITLGTSLVSGTISLVMYRQLASMPTFSANTGNYINLGAGGVQLYPGACLHLLVQSALASALGVLGTIYVENR